MRGCEKLSLRNRDYALFVLGQSELMLGENTRAASDFAKLEKLGGRFQVLAGYRRADALYAAKKNSEAKRAYEQALKQNSSEVDAAVAHFRVAEMSEAKAALSGFRHIYDEYPMHPLAVRALQKMKALDPSAEISPAERLQRAKIMSQNRAWKEALVELERVPASATAPLRDAAEHLAGTTLYRMRHDYVGAAEKLLHVWPRLPTEAERAEALFHGARAESRADRDDQAIGGYRQVVEHFSHSRFAAEASYLIGWIDFNRGRYRDAIPSLRVHLARYPHTNFSDDAEWNLGFSYWLDGKYEEAQKWFAMLGRRGGAYVGGKGDYWQARTLEKLGRSDEARSLYKKITADHPLSYYSTMARIKLAALGVATAPLPPAHGGAPAFGKLESAPQKDALILRVDELIEARLFTEASAELERGEKEFLKRYGHARALPLLLDRYVRGSDFHRPHLLAEGYGSAAFRFDPHLDGNARKWWQAMYPRAYQAFIEKYALSGKNPPYYLYTIMQKETAYDPLDVSYADAIGLLQMIPPTSRKVALQIGRPYTEDVLYDPEGNIEFGAWYIGHLLQKFSGQIPLGAGSYNAGPTAMRKWVTKNGTRPLDEFIELCPYTQTREYMKKVIDIYAHYVYLYAHEDYLPSLTVDTHVLDDDIEY